MKSWKARLLILFTMLMMLAATAVPAMANHNWDWYCIDWDEDGECDEWLLCREYPAPGYWECVGPLDAPDDWDDDDHDDDDDDDDDDDNHDDGSGLSQNIG